MRFKWSVFGNSKVVCLYMAKLSQVGIKRGQVQACNILIYKVKQVIPVISFLLGITHLLWQQVDIIFIKSLRSFKEFNEC